MTGEVQKRLQEMSVSGPSWLDASGREQEEVIISTTGSLSRSLHGYRFPHNSEESELREVMGMTWSAASQVAPLSNLITLSLDELSWDDRRFLAERYLIGHNMVEIDRSAGLAFDPDEHISMVVNEDDHFKTQYALPGLALEENWSLLEEVDEGLGRELPLSFRETFGFLTASPTNLGTGLRVSILVHLPALVLTNELEAVLRSATQHGVQIQGAHGESTAVFGNMFLVSNQLTFGRSESDILASLKRAATLLTDHELGARKTLWREARIQLEDKMHRSLALLRSARVLAMRECMNLLSAVRLGVNMEVCTDVQISKLDALVIIIQPSHLDRREGRVLDPSERDILRAELVRGSLDVTGGTGSNE
jgi:protein arginine kinase